MEAINRTVDKANEWMNRVKEELDSDDLEAYSSTKAVLKTLRSRLPAAEAAHFDEQLPTMLRGLYYEGYDPSAHPRKEIRSKDDFYQEVAEMSGQPVDGEAAAQAVLKVLKKKISDGELETITVNLPKNLKGR